MRRLWALALLIVISAGLGSRATSAPSGSPSPGDPYLPDLRTLDPYGIIADDSSAEPRFLFLSNTIWNAGDGPLELRPENDEEAGVTHAFQLLYTEDEDGNLVLLPEEHPAGSFEYHPEHNHWHFQDLARYTIHEMNPDGSVGTELARSEKISFCMFDERLIDGDLENAASSSYYHGNTCSENSNVGYSVGWGDEYSNMFFDQDIEITGLPAGKYWLRSEADPEKLLEETNNENNAAITAIELTDDGVLTITETTGSICKPCGRTRLTDGTRFAFKGRTEPSPGPRPSVPPLSVHLSFKRQGDTAWKPFGGSSSNRAFALLDEEDGTIAVDGDWSRDFVGYKEGDWVLRARFKGNDRFAASSVKVKVSIN